MQLFKVDIDAYRFQEILCTTSKTTICTLALGDFALLVHTYYKNIHFMWFLQHNYSVLTLELFILHKVFSSN